MTRRAAVLLILALAVLPPTALAADLPEVAEPESTEFKCHPNIEYYCKLAVCMVFGPWPCVII